MSLAFLTGAAVLGLLVSAVRSYERITVIEVNTHSAAVRYQVYRVLWGFRLRESLQPPVSTGLTVFLVGEQSVPGRGEWVRAGHIATDWRGRQTDVNLFHGINDLLNGAPFKPENLPRVHELVPDLPEMIRRDILGAKCEDVGAMLMLKLREMCADPSEDSVKRLREEWDWIKQNPGLFGGA